MWELDHKESWAPKNWCFWTVVLEKTLERPLDCKEIQPVHPKGDQSCVCIGRTDVEAETPLLWPPDAKSWVIWKDPDAGKDWGQEEKGMTEDKMVGWHHRLNGHGVGWTPGVGDGQGGLKYCGSWDHKLLDMTERLNWTERRWKLIVILGTLWMRMFLVYLLSWLTHGLNQMLRFAFLLNFKGFPLLSSLICCFWEPYYHSDSLSLFWEFFLPFLIKVFLSFFLIWGAREILCHFQIGKGCSSVLESYVLDSLWSKQYHHNHLLSPSHGKRMINIPFPMNYELDFVNERYSRDCCMHIQMVDFWCRMASTKINSSGLPSSRFLNYIWLVKSNCSFELLKLECILK